MTKKDYIKLAGAIRDNSRSGVVWTSDNHTIDRDKFIDALCDILLDDSPRFDAERFIAACQ